MPTNFAINGNVTILMSRFLLFCYLFLIHINTPSCVCTLMVEICQHTRACDIFSSEIYVVDIKTVSFAFNCEFSIRSHHSAVWPRFRTAALPYRAFLYRSIRHCSIPHRLFMHVAIPHQMQWNERKIIKIKRKEERKQRKKETMKTKKEWNRKKDRRKERKKRKCGAETPSADRAGENPRCEKATAETQCGNVALAIQYESIRQPSN